MIYLNRLCSCGCNIGCNVCVVNNLLEGVNLINDLEDFDVEVPVVINSTTQIPDFKFKKAEWETRGLKIYKTEYILDMKNWFVEFLKAE